MDSQDMAAYLSIPEFTSMQQQLAALTADRDGLKEQVERLEEDVRSVPVESYAALTARATAAEAERDAARGEVAWQPMGQAKRDGRSVLIHRSNDTYFVGCWCHNLGWSLVGSKEFVPESECIACQEIKALTTPSVGGGET